MRSGGSGADDRKALSFCGSAEAMIERHHLERGGVILGSGQCRAELQGVGGTYAMDAQGCPPNNPDIGQVIPPPRPAVSLGVPSSQC